ncbi:unnamed protein product [Cylicostephanus goldi]|uniref:Uncharacterized protein n=1 Tax=Cylicostephanus goldi TaxID=71465 RepID=A0A3P7QP79_CYLGO|nr:unnamed protein product [Cylicostephanus goldi]
MAGKFQILNLVILQNASAGYGGTERNVDESTKKHHEKQESKIAKEGMDSELPRGLDNHGNSQEDAKKAMHQNHGNSQEDAKKAMHQNVRYGKGPMKNDHQDKGATHVTPNETK